MLRKAHFRSALMDLLPNFSTFPHTCVQMGRPEVTALSSVWVKPRCLCLSLQGNCFHPFIIPVALLQQQIKRVGWRRLCFSCRYFENLEKVHKLSKCWFSPTTEKENCLHIQQTQHFYCSCNKAPKMLDVQATVIMNLFHHYC